jgi:anti-anti-sigma regulatory factor
MHGGKAPPALRDGIVNNAGLDMAAAPDPGMRHHPSKGRIMPDNDSHDFTITVTFAPRQARTVVALAGDLDIDAWPDLTDAIHQLTATPAGTVTVDVAAVRFVGAVLPNFLVQVRQAVPTTSLLTVSHPSLMARFVLAVTEMAQFAKIDDAFSA